MANYHAMAATSQTLVNLLTGARPTGVLHNIDIALLPLDEGVTLTKGLAVCLYRIAPNTSRRYPPSRPTADGTRYRPAINLDLFYALIPIGNGSDIQQRLLGWAIRTLEDMTVLPATLLNRNTPDTFAADETVELVFEGLALQDLSTLWENVKPQPLLMANFVARSVSIDSTLPVIQAGDVQTRQFDLAKVSS